MPITFIHTADWQLGKPFARISDPDKAAKVRNERLEVITRIGDAVREEKASFVLLAGDIFDSFAAEKSVVSAACSAIGGLGVPVIAIPGNHDHGGPGCLWEQPFFLKERESLAPNFHLLLKPEPFPLAEAVILPCPLLRRHEAADPTAWIREFDFDALSAAEGNEKPRIVLAHGSVHGFDSSGDSDEDDNLSSPNLIALDRLPREEIDFVALGDWHGTREIQASAWYSGTPETDRFPKGGSNQPGNILSVSLARSASPTVKTIPTGKLGWHTIACEFAGDDDIAKLRETLEATLGSRAAGDLVHLTLTGSLGIEATTRLEDLIETLEARLLRLKLKNSVRIAPSEEEIAALTERGDDPLISSVAAALLRDAAGAGEEALIARLALRELHAAATTP